MIWTKTKSYDYENVSSESAEQLMNDLRAKFVQLGNGGKLESGESIASADDFEYTDKFDSSVAKAQVYIFEKKKKKKTFFIFFFLLYFFFKGIRFTFEDGSRFVFRLSGTGSSGATIR